MAFSFIDFSSTTIVANTDTQYIHSGTIAPDASPAFHFGTATRTSLTTDGGLFGSNAIVSSSMSQGDLSITLNEGSSATGLFNGIFLSGFNGRIENSGNVTGLSRSGIGLYESAEGFSVRNSGSITGETLGLDLRGQSHEIFNSGEVTGTRGILVRSEDTNILNTGTILGLSEITTGPNGIGIEISDQVSGTVVINSGLIAGAVASVSGGDLGDELYNSGQLVGDVLLGAGDDVYLARAGGQTEGFIRGGEGSDYISGGQTRDLIRGDDGADRLYGRSGDDDIRGGSNADLLVGGGGEDVLNGNRGDDRIYGGDGDDLLLGDGAEDAYPEWGGWEEPESSNDVLKGGNGNDQLEGGYGRDVLMGGTGDDVLIGQEGRDVLFSGAGRDSFVFNRVSDSYDGSLRDAIRDFDRGQDILDLSDFEVTYIPNEPLPADAGLPYRDATLSFIGTNAFSGDGLEIRYVVTAAGSSVVRVDTDGDLQQDMEILVQNVGALSASDFLL